MDLATLAAAPTVVRVGDRDFRIGPLRYRELGILQRHLNATRAKPPVIGRDHAWPSDLLSDVAGVEVFVGALFGIHQEVSSDDLLHIMAHVGRDELAYLYRVGMDIGPEDEGADPGPKAEPAPPTG